MQQTILDIFKNVSSILEKENIPYFGIAGTVLGAVRHKGFIPWDDDMDIVIPIEYWEKFINIISTSLPDHLELVNSMDIKHVPYFACVKITDKRTAAIEYSNLSYKDAYSGVWLDVFPICGVGNDTVSKKKFIRKSKLFFLLDQGMRNLYKNTTHKAMKYLLSLICFPLQLIFPFNHYLKKSYELFKQYPISNSIQTGTVWWPLHIDRHIYPSELFKHYVYIDFEDTQIRCPADWKEYLTLAYGNYTQLPPVENRNSGHDLAIVDFEHSYKDYQIGNYTV